MDQFRELLRALGAIVVLAVLLIGVPAALMVSVGWPLPSVVPSWAEVSDALTGGAIADMTVHKAIALVIWVAWVQVAVAVVVEAWSLLRGRAARPAPLTFSAVQLGVGRLLSSALLLSAVIHPRAAYAVASAPPAPAAAPQALAPAEAPVLAAPSTSASAPSFEASDAGTKEWIVHQRETLWGIAEQALGDGRRYREIADLNQGRAQPDGSTFTDPGAIRTGWVLLLPPDATVEATPAGSHRVVPGDSLSSIAQARLGDAGQWSTLWELNRDRPQPNGSVFSDPNLLRPGWVLDLPSAPALDNVVVTAPSAEVAPVPSSVAPDPEAGPATEPGPETAPSATLPDLGEAPPATEPVPSTTASAEPSPTSEDLTTSAGEDEEEGQRAPVGLAGAGLVAAGALVLLDRRRRAALRRRSSKRLVHVPPPRLQRAESVVRAGASIEAATYLDAALRAAAASTGGSFPGLRWVEVAASSVLLVTDCDSIAPAGFTTEGPGRWRSAADLEQLLDFAGETAPPTPALTAVGTTPEGAEILLDLEALGTTVVTGDRERVVGLLCSMALSLGTATWSEYTRVVLVGLGGELTQLTSVDTAAGWEEAVRIVTDRAEESLQALEAIGENVTAKARAAGTTVDAWHPTVVVGLGPAEGVIEIPNLPGGQAVAAVVGSASEVATALHVDEHGYLRVPETDLVILARSLAEDDTRVIVELLESAEGNNEDDDAEVFELLDPAPAAIPLTGEAAETIPTVQELLDDLDVLVRVMGEVEAVRLGPDGDELIRPGKHRGLELLAYLSRLQSPASTEDISAAMWPGGANSVKTLHNVVSDLRGCLGADRDGQPLFPPAKQGRYMINERVMTDFAVFRTLVDVAAELDDQQAPLIADILSDALTLVRGEPFMGGGRSYAWVSHQRGAIVTTVLDAAEEVTEIRLKLGDWKAAEWAARQGLRAFPADERLYRLLMHCAHAAGNVAGVQRVFNELCDVVADPDVGVEPEDTIHPETVALLEELLGRRQSLGA